ncbi:ABC transporter permease [Butyrivibrio sp. VCD2006]|uniref:ABC transporter permease n=1 Tax=Butyrivibrio sp. VCD2006 TaxID=1280664 RepID=UPI0004267C65|nr:ABC transporter permease [Butyrivibrio sp. VCD2006]
MKENTSIFKKPGFQTLLASVLCAVLGIILGYIILLFMNPEHAAEGMFAILRNFFKFAGNQKKLMNAMGSIFVKSVPVILCAEAILFAYKTGLFNIGCAGQYTVGIIASLYTALALHWSWILCVLSAILAGALWGAICGFFKAYCNVNEVIAGIMLNWIALYVCNIILGNKTVMNTTKSETYPVKDASLLPAFLSEFFGKNKYMTIAVPLTIIIAIAILWVLNQTTFGYELKATGHSKDAAKYAGMNAKRNIILSLVISGAIAGMAAGLYYLTGIEHYKIASSVPGMGFSGIAVAFLGGLHPIGTIFAGLFVTYITQGGQYLNTNYYNPQVADLMIAIIIYLCGFVLFFKTIINKPKKIVTTTSSDNNAADKTADKKEV